MAGNAESAEKEMCVSGQNLQPLAQIICARNETHISNPLMPKRTPKIPQGSRLARLTKQRRPILRRTQPSSNSKSRHISIMKTCPPRSLSPNRKHHRQPLNPPYLLTMQFPQIQPRNIYHRKNHNHIPHPLLYKNPPRFPHRTCWNALYQKIPPNAPVVAQQRNRPFQLLLAECGVLDSFESVALSPVCLLGDAEEDFWEGAEVEVPEEGYGEAGAGVV